MQFKPKVVFIKEVPAGTPISYGSIYVTPQKTIIATVPVGMVTVIIGNFLIKLRSSLAEEGEG